MASKAMAGLLAAGVVAAAAVVIVLRPAPDGLKEGAVTPLPSVTIATASDSTAAPAATISLTTQQSVTALCQVRTAQVVSLLGGATGTARFEALRDAIPALGERITDVEAAAAARTQATPVLTAVQGVYTDWTTALTSHDGGQDAASTQAMTSAATKIKTLDQAIKRALPATAKC